MKTQRDRAHGFAFPLVRFCLRLGFGVTVLLTSSTAIAYRSGKDLPAMAGEQKVRFSGPTIQIELNESLPLNLSFAKVDGILSGAAATWMSPSCTNVTFVVAGHTAVPAARGDGKNTVQWVYDWAKRGFDSKAAAITDVQYEKSSDGHWRISEGDIYLNGLMTWGDGANSEMARDVRSVLTHEIGHLLGLLHPCELDGADGAPLCGKSDVFSATCMYPLQSVKQRELSADDVEGVCWLYSAQACQNGTCPAGEICTPEGCRIPCGNTTCAVSERCTSAGCLPGTCKGGSCAGLSCSADADCGGGESCRDGVCLRGQGLGGDPCTSDAECMTGMCHSQGYCSSRCTDSSECSSGATCDVSGGTGVCSAVSGSFGASCAVGNQCMAGVCLDIDGAGVCSRECTAGRSGCPVDSTCSEVDAEYVCVPKAALEVSRVACSYGAGAANSSLRSGVVACGTIAMVVMRLRRRRKSMCSGRV